MPRISSHAAPASIKARTWFVAACLLLVALAVSITLMPAGDAATSVATVGAPEGLRERRVSGEARARLADAYGKLPLRFEANRGQTSREVRFVSRGNGYALFLTPMEAVLRLRNAECGMRIDKTDAAAVLSSAPCADTLRVRLQGANSSPKVVGLDELPGRSNYLVGGDPRFWRTGVPNFGKVRYESVYPGINVVYYGNEGQLEYDFEVAPGADPRRIRMRFEGARALRVDERGDLVITTRGGEVRQRKPIAFQEADGARSEVAARYTVDARGSVRVVVGDYDSRRPLVIDPVLIYSSYLGGLAQDLGHAVAVDPAGSAYVVGSTFSANFPGPSPLQGAKDALNDAYVVKLSPDGRSFVYATYLGGDGSDVARAVAVDSSGNAYVAGLTGSGSFPRTPGVFQGSKDGSTDAFVAKLNPTGTSLVYSTFLGGNGGDIIFGIAVDPAGAAYVAGNTNSTSFAGFPAETRAGSPVQRSVDAAAHWSASSAGLTASAVNDFAVAPSDANVIYAGTSLGVYKSTDGGGSWQLTGQARTSTAPPSTSSVAVDPSNANVVYAGTLGDAGVYKSTDGGTIYEQQSNGLFTPIVNTLVINPSTPTTIYAGTVSGLFKSTNGGDAWALVESGNALNSATRVNKIVIDPANSQVLYVATDSGVVKSADGGAAWVAVNNGLTFFGSPQDIASLALDPSQTSTLYAGSSSIGGIYKSTNGGASWTNSSNGFVSTGVSSIPPVSALLVDPSSPSIVYAATTGFGGGGGLFKSMDGGANWTPSMTGMTNKVILALAARGTGPTTILAGANVGNDAFVAKLNPAGSQLEYLRLLGGSEIDIASGIAIGPDKSAYVTGATFSSDFPTANAFRQTLNGISDAYVVKVNPTGSGFVYSTFLGGSSTDRAGGVAVGQGGEAYVAGTTFSTDFPVANAMQTAQSDIASFGDAFVTKLAADGQSLAYSTYLGGDFSEQGLGIAVGTDGSAYVTGLTNSSNFPVFNVAGGARGGSNDAFVAKLNPTGSALLFSTYIGGSASDQGNGVAVDATGGIYVVGNTSSANFPIANAARGTLGGGTDAFVAKFGPGVDLAVTLTDSPDPVAFGSDLTYSVNVKNNGDLPATGVVLTDVLPAGATLVSATTNHGTCFGATTVDCNLGTLNGGELATVTIIVKPPALRTISNTVSIALNETDAAPANNSASTDTTVDFADLTVSKSALLGVAAPGSKVIYLLNVTNKRGIATGPVTLVDNLPPEVSFLSCDSPRGTCGGTGNSRSVTFPSLAVGASESAVIVATVNPSVAAGTFVNNTATASAALADPDTSNNTSAASINVGPGVIAAKSNGKIAFRAEGPSTRISTVNPDGTGLTPLTPGLDSDRKPVWSPDGTKIAYRSTTRTGSAPAPENIVVMNADGTGPVTVTTVAAFDGNVPFESKPTWSPAGDYIAFVGGDLSIYVVRPDGTGLTRLIVNTAPISGLDWSPDGSHFAAGITGSLFVMDLDGGNRRQLTTQQQTSDGPTIDSGPDWSPDGSRILFARSTLNRTLDTLVINADGTGLTRLLNIQGISRATWSPDGMKVAFPFNGISVANVDGSGLPVTVAPGISDPSWQPLVNSNPTPTPTPATTFTISGRVTNADGSAGAATLKLSGTRTATIFTDDDGNYIFVNLPQGGAYTITPVRDLNIFTPGSRTISSLQQNQTGLDFVAAPLPRPVIRGRLTDSEGRGLGGVNVTLRRFFGQLITTTTDTNGNYSFTVFPGEGYSVQPISSSFSFDQFRANLAPVLNDATANFVGVPFAGIHNMQARVVDAAGFGIAGLPVALGGARTAVVKTDVDGFVTFSNLPAGQTYTLTPSAAGGFAFTPPQLTFANLSTDPFVGINATTAQPSAQFAPTTQAVAENAGLVELTVTRTGDLSAAGSVDFETADLTASERSDYTAAYSTVRFDKGEGIKSLRVLVTDDALVEGERAFTVTLKSGSGVRLGGATTATVTITEDDAAPASQNPIDDSRAFVRQHYVDFLNRETDASGLGFWTGEIEGCGADAQCREIKRINVSAAFFLSIEFKETGYLVYRMHHAAFGTGERLRLKTFLRDTREVGRGVVVGQGAWEQQLEANKRAFADDFVLRPEFIAAYPLTMSPAQFVDALNANTGGALTTPERDALASELASNAKSRGETLRAVAENAEFSRRQLNRAFVLMQYFGYLRRGPNEPPDSDFAGHAFWLQKLNQFGGNFVGAEMVKAFITSTEYRRRFAP